MCHETRDTRSREERRLDGLAAVAEWEAENGEITEEEMAAARERIAPELEPPVRRPAV